MSISFWKVVTYIQFPCVFCYISLFFIQFLFICVVVQRITKKKYVFASYIFRIVLMLFNWLENQNLYGILIPMVSNSSSVHLVGHESNLIWNACTKSSWFYYFNFLFQTHILCTNTLWMNKLVNESFSIFKSPNRHILFFIISASVIKQSKLSKSLTEMVINKIFACKKIELQIKSGRNMCLNAL